MNRPERTILRDIAVAYFYALQSYEQHSSRGDVDRTDEALSQMQQIERCVSVRENSTAWRNVSSKGGRQ